MSLEILGHRLLVKPDPLEAQVDLPEVLKGVNFEVHKPVQLQKLEEAGTQIGTVLQVGSMAWKAFDGNQPDWKPWVKAGDRIIFARYAGKFVDDPETKERFMVINDEDVQVKITSKTPIEEIFTDASD
jgi:co-chaperonin GroES (HSP10)